MRNASEGTYNGDITFCPVNAYGACLYCDQCNICHIDNPQEDCDDWQIFWESWDEWLKADDIEDDQLDFSAEEIAWACEKYEYGKDGE